jgi:hypothetical protein
MKTPRFILIAVLFVSVFASAQPKISQKADSLVIACDTSLIKQQRPLKIDKLFGSEKYGYRLPNQYFQPGQNLALNPNKQQQQFNDPNFRMPVLKPDSKWKMPVMKPDSSIHYHLLIKKIERPVIVKKAY